ncbi:MAG: hypothetical protein QOK14_1267 [Frankiaceae bacterium]|jgi:hypothetical protein|nr:hypothetical protein [Frankiaceae bacterium]
MAVIEVPTGRRSRRPYVRVLVIVVVVAAVAMIGRNLWVSHIQHVSHDVPQSAAMEDKLGVRFSRVAVVADGGLVTLSYVVLDPEKAQRFQAATTTPPVLVSGKGSLSHVALMKQGHAMRAGQSYYLVYQDTNSAVRDGDRIEITYGDLRLADVPVW